MNHPGAQSPGRASPRESDQAPEVESATAGAQDTYPWTKRAALIGGPALAVALRLLPPPAGLSPAGWAVAAVGLLMVTWWITEAVPLAATALLPLVLLPLLGAVQFEKVAASFSDPLIFLFLGGFLLARALQRWQLDRRIALLVLRWARGRPAALVACLMAATAFLSLWISNTATAMAMLPVGQAVVSGLRVRAGATVRASELDRFSAALVLGIAYAASIGGMGTLIGTPPNALFAGFMRETYGIAIGFVPWLAVGLPAVLLLLPAAWFILTRMVFRFDLPASATTRAALAAEASMLGPMTSGERLTALLLGLAVLGWLAQPVLRKLLPGVEITDAGIAICAALLLFVVPVRLSRGEFLLAWNDAVRLPWGVLLLFGGGLALADAITGSGLAAWIGDAVSGLAMLPGWLLVLALVSVVVLLGELASNTAVAAVFLPVAGAAAIGLGQPPLTLTLPVALAASIGFMLPVATPANAIAFGSGAVTARQMMRAGILLDLAGIAVVVLVARLVGPLAMGGR